MNKELQCVMHMHQLSMMNVIIVDHKNSRNYLKFLV